MALAILFFPLASPAFGLFPNVSNLDMDNRHRPSHLGRNTDGNSRLFPETYFYPSDSGQVRLLDFITIWTNLTSTVWLTVVYNNSLLNVKQFVWILPRENLSVNGQALVQGETTQWTIRQAGSNLTIIRQPSLTLYVVKLRAINSVNDIPELREEFQAVSSVSFNTAVSWVLQAIISAPLGVWFFSKWRRSRI